jgi:hypothetical protein
MGGVAGTLARTRSKWGRWLHQLVRRSLHIVLAWRFGCVYQSTRRTHLNTSASVSATISGNPDMPQRPVWFAQSRAINAHRDNGRRLVVRADEKLTAFMELESAIRRLRLTMGRKSVGSPTYLKSGFACSNSFCVSPSRAKVLVAAASRTTSIICFIGAAGLNHKAP